MPDVDGNLGLYRVGLVLEAGKHPNADRLQLCTVDVGDGEPRQIVCGAWNFGAGAYVAVALPGAVMPGGQKLEQAKLRGVVSNGMILSERELEIGPDHSGIIVLGKPTDPGTPLADVLPLGEEVIEAETSFNRPDLLSIYGIAREVAAVFNAELRPMPGREPDRPVDPEPVEVRVDDPAGCPRYIGRLFHDARIGPSPEWMKARLSAAGQRPISNAVDITNYVMLALGSPLHAFDRRKLAAGPDHRPAGGAGGGGSHARRRAARARPLRSRDRRRRARGRARRDHGRRGDRALRRHLGHPARGRELRAGRDHAHARSGSRCAPRARTAGRRVSTRTSPSRPRSTRPSCWSR